MKAVKNGKIVIIGAGHVGSHCGLSLMMQGLADEIVYIDIDKNKAAMQALDLDDMASNLDRDFTVRAGDYSDCADAHIVVMAAGKSRLPGQTRLDMFDDSIKMMNTIVGKTHNCPDDSSANPLKVFLPDKLYTPRQANE